MFWNIYNCNGGVMVSALASSAVDRWLERRLGQIKSKDYEIGICCSPLSTQHYGEKADCLARNQDNVSEWGDMVIRGLLCQ